MPITPVPGSCVNCGGSGVPTDVTVVGPVAVTQSTSPWVISGTVATTAAHAEDSAHVSGHVGDFALAVRNDADAVLTSNDLDYSPFAVDSSGRLKVVTAPVTLTSQGRVVGAGLSWTPGTDVVGVLTSVTFSVMTGTTTLTDADGTVSAGLLPGISSTWSVSDGNTLTGPQSISAVGGNTFVTWTQR